MAIILNVLEGNVVFTNHVISNDVAFTNHFIEGDVVGNAMRSVPDYHGSYEITPTQSTQILNVSDKRMAQDLVIKPIPSNYGLITWNGSTLTVS